MARFSPLPSVSLDPRNESELVQAASQRVYEASNRTLNDFSAGNPLAVLLEGQAFAQGEFLFWANQLPDKILLQWIGPFLGAMRRLGTPSSAELAVQVSPSSTTVLIPTGSVFTTDPQKTGGQIYEFITDRDYSIVPGETKISVVVYSRFLGSAYNVPANSITSTLTNASSNFVVTNPQPSAGGSDVETFQQVQERFFTLIRRRNPVSGTDWQDFFTDLYGEGTLTSVQPNRTSFSGYKYETDYTEPNGNVSFFVLGPDGVELTDQQIVIGQRAINYNLPIGNRAFLYPLTLSPVHYDIQLVINSRGPYGVDQRSSSLDFRNRLFQILTPGEVFPADSSPSVGDVDAAFHSTFESDVRFRDPKIEKSRAYNTPNGMGRSSATYTNIKSFSPSENLFSQGDLIILDTPNPTFYPVESGFTPYSSQKRDQPLYNNLALKQIKKLVPGSYSLGDIVYYDGEYDSSQIGLHVIKDNLVVDSSDKIPLFFSNGKISNVKGYSPWVEGNSYQYSSGGFVDPEIVEYDYQEGEFSPGSVTDPIPLNMRPGGLAWVVSRDFTLSVATNNVAGAISQSVLGDSTTPLKLVTGESYTPGTWVYTPILGSGPDSKVDPYYHFVDSEKGVLSKYALVQSNFTFDSSSSTVSESFGDLLLKGTLVEVNWVHGGDGLPIYKYKSRFKVGDYIQYKERPTSEVSYYVSSSYFTPDTTNIQDLVQAGLLIPLAPTSELKTSLSSRISSGAIREFTKLFTFMPGDRTFFRDGTEVFSYTATKPVTPLFDFDLYLENGVFVSSDDQSTKAFEPGDFIPFYSPRYQDFAEDTLVGDDGKTFYRVMKSFVPAEEVIDWSGVTVKNSIRNEEYNGNVLRYVSAYSGDEEILPQLNSTTSSIKLGTCQVTLIQSSSNSVANSTGKSVFIWEQTETPSETPQLSWYSGVTSHRKPPTYGEGTLAL
jgi:hypothetical protein